MRERESMSTPQPNKELLAGELKFVAEQMKAKGKTVNDAVSKARQENARFLKELNDSLPDEKVREVVHGVYGVSPRKLFLNTKLMTFTPIEQADWLEPHVLLRGALNLFVGAPDIGKTLVAIYYIAKLTRQGKRVVVICREDSYGMVWKPRLIAANANLDLVLCVSGVKEQEDGEEHPWFLDSDSHREALREVLSFDVELVVIDPLADFAGSKDLNKQQDCRALLTPLNKMAQDTGVAMLVLTHTTKAVVDSVIKSAAGSFQLMAGVAVSWYFTKDPDNVDQRLMLQARNKYGQKRGFKYTIESTPYPKGWPGVPDDLEDGIGVMRLKGKETRTADELLERTQDKDNGIKTQIRRWLNEMLKNGPVATQQAGEEMNIRNFNMSTVKDVCREMGVVRDGKSWSFKRQMQTEQMEFDKEQQQ